MQTIILLGPRGLRLRADVPETRRERMRGLLDRPGLDPDEALLLERARSIHTFGMRFAIAAALLDWDGVVRCVVRMQPRHVLLPRPRVRDVLEVSPGADVRPGDRLIASKGRTRAATSEAPTARTTRRRRRGGLG